MSDKLPTYRDIMDALVAEGYQAYLVGGAVRDAYIDREISDYDLTTDATPDEILAVFPSGKFVNATFAVSVIVPSSEVGGHVEISTMREEDDRLYSHGKPTDFSFVMDITKDLGRRDATINAMAMDRDGNIIDPFGGRDDIKNKRVVAVGNPTRRIKAHPIRMMRYIRMARCLGDNWTMDTNLANAIVANAKYIVLESWEAISKEFLKGLACPNPDRYLMALKHTGILQIIMPEIVEAFTQKQNKFPVFDTVWEHLLSTVRVGAFMGRTALENLAALLHDIGKPGVAEYKSATYGNSFYGHETTSALLADVICKRLRITNEDRKLIVLAIRNHMFRIDSPQQARKFLRKMDNGENNSIDTIAARAEFAMRLKSSDALGRDDNISMVNRIIRERELLEAAIEEESAITVRDLKVNGYDIMDRLGIGQGRAVGNVLNSLLELVTDDKLANDREKLLDVAARLYENQMVAVA